MKKHIAVLPGDGIGPEIVNEAINVLDAIAVKFGHEFEYKKALVGGTAYDEYKEHLPQKTIDIIKSTDAVFLGAIGGPVDKQDHPKWKDAEKNSVLGLRKVLQVGINLRPVNVYDSLSSIACLCPVR